MGLLRRRGSTGPDTTTIAIAGAGAMAAIHALAAPAAACRVVAVASAGGRSARHLAGQLDDRDRGHVRHVPVDALPAGADLLVVATPPATHAELVLQGLAAGADVLVEKPFTTTLADADRLVDAAVVAAAADGAILRCAENLLHAPFLPVVAAHRSSMGPLRHLSARTVQPQPTWGHFAAPLTAGGALFDLGPHALSMVIAIAGEPIAAVAARLGSTRQDGADDDAVVELRFASGLSASVEVSWTAATTEWSLQAASDDGVIRVELSPAVLVELDGEPVEIADHVAGLADPALERMGYVQQLRSVSAAARGDTTAGPQSPDAARHVIEVICAAYASAGLGGREVPLPFAGDRTLTPMQHWRQ